MKSENEKYFSKESCLMFEMTQVYSINEVKGDY